MKEKLTRRYCNLDENSYESEVLFEISTDIFYKYISIFSLSGAFYDVWALDGGSIIIKFLYGREDMLELVRLGSPKIIREVVDENIGFCFEYCFGTVSYNSINWRIIRKILDARYVRYNIRNDSNNGEVTLSISPYIQYTSLSDSLKRVIKRELDYLANEGWINSYNNDTDVFLKLRR